MHIKPNSYLYFERNRRNTPVYMLSQGDVTIEGTVYVTGQAAANTAGIGYTKRGGAAGPGGGDGGSCDTLDGSRAGGGLGPGGGSASPNGAGGGGASPINNGGKGYAAAGAGGGSAPSEWQHQMIFGGSGGACGNGQAGSGGGGVLVIAASGTIVQNGYLLAYGGASGKWHGGGGGGVVRLVATAIQGNGVIDVRGNNASACGNSSWGGGCGGHGLVKVEGYTVGGTFMQSANPLASLYFSKPQPAVPGGLLQPTLTVTRVTGATGGPQTPPDPDLRVHVHTPSPGVYLDDGQEVTVEITATNVPVGTTAKVRLRTLRYGTVVITSTPLVGTNEASTATATLALPAGTRLTTIDAWIPDVPVAPPIAP